MRKSEIAARIAGFLFALCLVYVLSVGPVAGLMAWGGIYQGHPLAICADIVYAPILYLHTNTPLKEPLDRYARWWERLGERLR